MVHDQRFASKPFGVRDIKAGRCTSMYSTPIPSY